MKTNNFGIESESYQRIVKALSQFREIDEAIVFGSRAMGNYKKGSDIDLALLGKELTTNHIFRIRSYLNEELAIPYNVDIVHYDTVENEELKKHIDEEGKLFLSDALLKTTDY